MKICIKHWTDLTAAINVRGMRHLARETKALEMKEAVKVASRENDAATFNPLMFANFGILLNALTRGGPYLMDEPENGSKHFCPLCELGLHSDTDPVLWINSSADESLNQAQHLELMPMETQQ